ncbi:MAG: response regulator [Chitinophagaceae bacterium]|nr:response regulator [Chitinophagaceae bacterium]
MSQIQHTVCLIDDDKIYQFTAKKMLEATGMAKDIRSFYDGSEAIAFFSGENSKDPENLPDVIFLDINMPIMNGWEFLEEYEKIKNYFPKSMALYVVSSSVDDADIRRSRQYDSVTDYIVKPITRMRYQELLEGIGSIS